MAQKTWLGADLQQLIDSRHRQWVRIPVDDQAMPVQIFRYLEVSEVLEIVARTMNMVVTRKSWRWIRSGWRGGLMRKATSASRIVRSNSPSVSCKLT